MTLNQSNKLTFDKCNNLTFPLYIHKNIFDVCTVNCNYKMWTKPPAVKSEISFKPALFLLTSRGQI